MGEKSKNKKTSENDRTIIMSDEYLSESGVQGGKVITEHIALCCVIIGIPLFIIGVYAITNMTFGLGYLINTAQVIGVVLVIVIGLILIFSGYSLYRTKHVHK